MARATPLLERRQIDGNQDQHQRDGEAEAAQREDVEQAAQQRDQRREEEIGHKDVVPRRAGIEQEGRGEERPRQQQEPASGELRDHMT